MAGMSYLQWGNELLPFLLPLKCNYEELFKRQKEENHQWTKYSDNGSKLGLYKEVKCRHYVIIVFC